MLRATLGAILAAYLALTTHSSAEPVAKVVSLYGKSNASGAPLSVGSTVEEHNRITVEGPGNVQLLFTDGTKLVIGPRSSLVIEKYLMRGGNSADAVAVDAIRGTFRFITGRSAKSAYSVKTANATIGIRGTGFDFWVADGTGLALVQGRVRLCDSAGKCIDMAPNCDVGFAKPGQTRLLRGFSKGSLIRSRLPYILDQSSLNRGFRLNVSACERSLSLSADGAGSSAPPTKEPRQCFQTACP